MWTITRLENLSGVYVECYRFLIFVVTDSVYYKYQYRLTYTLCSDLNSVSLYESERTREEIFIRIKGDNMSTFLNAFFTNSQRPVVDCLTVAAGILARSQEVIKGTGADQRFVKNAFKNAECHPLFL